jgi:hypothetical protein
MIVGILANDCFHGILNRVQDIWIQQYAIVQASVTQQLECVDSGLQVQPLQSQLKFHPFENQLTKEQQLEAK